MSWLYARMWCDVRRVCVCVYVCFWLGEWGHTFAAQGNEVTWILICRSLRTVDCGRNVAGDMQKASEHWKLLRGLEACVNLFGGLWHLEVVLLTFWSFMWPLGSVLQSVLYMFGSVMRPLVSSLGSVQFCAKAVKPWYYCYSESFGELIVTSYCMQHLWFY